MRKGIRLRGNTFVYLLALIIILVTASTAIVGGISYRVSAGALEAETRQALLMREAQLVSRIETEIRTFQSYSQGLSLNRSVLDQLTNASSMRMEDILRFREIIQALGSLERSMPQGSVIAIYFNRARSVATHSTRYMADDFFMRYDEANRENIQSRLLRPQAFTMLVDVESDIYRSLPGQRVLLFGKGLPYSSPYPFGGAIVEVPIAYLESMLVPDTGGVQFVLGEGNELLLAASNSENPDLLGDSIALIHGMSLRPGTPFWLDATLCGEPHFVTISVSSQDQWKYVTVLPAHQVYAGIRNISRVTLGVGMAAAVLALIISSLALHRLYTPIRSLLDVLALRGTPYLPRQHEGRDLEHIRALVNTAWNENENMHLLIDGMRSLMRQELLNRLLDNSAVPDEAIAQCGLAELDGYFRVMLPEITPISGAISRYALCMRAIDYVSEAGHPADMIHCVIRPQEQVALLLRSPKSRAEEDLMPLLKAFLRAIDREATVPSTLAVAHEMHGLRTLGDGHMQAQETLYWAVTSGRPGIVTHAEVLRSGSLDMTSLLRRDTISQGDAMRSLYAHAVSHGDYLVAYLLQYMQDSGETENAGEALRSIMQMDSTGDRLDFVMRLSRRKEAGSSHKAAEPLMQYLSEHYSDVNLSLSVVADQFGYTSNYISTIIKEETGMGFLECLTRIRLDKAVTLLETTDLKIADITSLAGFGHVNTFIRTFRRYYQSTPAQYRAESKRNGNK